MYRYGGRFHAHFPNFSSRVFVVIGKYCHVSVDQHFLRVFV